VDLVGVALGALAAGGCGGAALVALLLAALRHSLDAVLLVLPFTGIVVAAGLAWRCSGPIADWWRRGVTAALAVFGAMMLAALTAPADMIGGRPGLAALGIVLAAAALAAARFAHRSGSRAR